MNGGFLIINNVKLPLNASLSEAFTVAKSRLRRAGLPAGLSLSVYRRSIDARDKRSIIFVYSIAAFGEFGTPDPERLAEEGITVSEPVPELSFTEGKEQLSHRPVVVGLGPSGLFAALLLAERGYRPIILERGGTVEERRAATERLVRERILDPETNIQFGAGGAGTFSDGKLVTRINDPLTQEVLKRLVEFGADESIKYIAKPHIGTDRLALIVSAMAERIEELGGEIHYHTRFLAPIVRGDTVVGVKTSIGDIPTGAVLLCIGHSARDTHKTLIESGYDITAKSFSVGMRIEHKREDIDKALYGDFAGHPELGAAEYNLSADTKARGVYTFCMCPGGVVVPAASEEGGVVVNGMSYSARDRENSNSAVACSVFTEDYGGTPLAAIDFQRRIERLAFAAGGGDYSAPVITVGDFLSGQLKSFPKEVMPSYMDGAVRLARPEEFLPVFVTESIGRALTSFGRRIKGFDSPSAVLTGAETRTSSPVRIMRNMETRLATGYSNFYPVGEGAGYAGGITSAAVDGIRSAAALITKYKPFKG